MEVFRIARRNAVQNIRGKFKKSHVRKFIEECWRQKPFFFRLTLLHHPATWDTQQEWVSWKFLQNKDSIEVPEYLPGHTPLMREDWAKIYGSATERMLRRKHHWSSKRKGLLKNTLNPSSRQDAYPRARLRLYRLHVPYRHAAWELK